MRMEGQADRVRGNVVGVGETGRGLRARSVHVRAVLVERWRVPATPFDRLRGERTCNDRRGDARRYREHRGRVMVGAFLQRHRGHAGEAFAITIPDHAAPSQDARPSRELRQADRRRVFAQARIRARGGDLASLEAVVDDLPHARRERRVGRRDDVALPDAQRLRRVQAVGDDDAPSPFHRTQCSSGVDDHRDAGLRVERVPRLHEDRDAEDGNRQHGIETLARERVTRNGRRQRPALRTDVAQHRHMARADDGVCRGRKRISRNEHARAAAGCSRAMPPRARTCPTTS